jgi:hypothetical protein
MSPPDHSPLANEDIFVLHERLLASDPTASVDLANIFLDRLVDWLIKHNPQADTDLCETAAEDAILGLIKNPVTYKPERQTLEVYLRISASGDLKNLLRSGKRHSERRADWEAVEHSSKVGKYLGDETANPEFILEHSQEEVTAQALIPISVRASLTEKEMRILELMKENERKTSVYASELGISHLPTENQKKEVKRIKDRLKKRIERAKESP